ncbi:DUF1768-domain-containing protein, partial [Aureobasidium melanogenum]
MGKKHNKQSNKQQSTPSNPNKTNTEPTNPNLPTRNTIGTPILFFKDDEQPFGFLCQWYRCRFTDPTSGLEFTCAEQYMTWNKAHLAGDEVSARAIMATTSPRKQKQLGRDVQGFDVDAWEKIKLDVVEKGNYLKFTQGTNVSSMKMEEEGDPVLLKKLLLETGDRELVEASRFDRVWGVGFDAQQALAVPREKWGWNLLGIALMNVRERIREEAEGRVEAAVDQGETESSSTFCR